MKGTATITTQTTVTPVTVTEVKNGTVQCFEWYVHHRPDPRRDQVVHARGHRQARREDHARWQTRERVRLPSGRCADRDHHHVEAAAGHDAAASERDPRGGRPPASGARASGGCGTRAVVVREPAGTGGPAGERLRAEDTAEDRQFVAVARAREHRVTRDRARSDDRAPLRPVGSFAVAGTAFARRHVSAVTGSISTERCRSTVSHGPAATTARHPSTPTQVATVAITHIVAVLTARRDDVRNGVRSTDRQEIDGARGSVRGATS